MEPRILSTIDVNGLEKVCCVHGSWVTIGYAAHLTGHPAIILDNIHLVIPHLLKRHPRMRTRLRIDGFQAFLDVFDYDENYFNPTLFYSIRESTDQSWQQIVDEECNRNPYINHGSLAFPLFHFVIVSDRSSSVDKDDQSFHLLLFSHHAVSDGRSGFILINDVLTLATSPDLSNHIEPVNQTILPCLVNLMPRPYGPFYYLKWLKTKRLFKKELPMLVHPRIPIQTIPISNEPSNSRFVPVKIRFIFSSTSSTLYKRLREKCHSQQVTLHGPLFACLLLTVDHCFPLENTDRRYLSPWNIDLDIDMRARLPGSPLTSKTVGFCIGINSVMLKRRYPLRTVSFWKMAKKYVAATNKIISGRALRFHQHFLSDLFRNERTWNEVFAHASDGRVGEMNFSNIGKYPFSTEYHQGQLHLRGFHVVNNASVYRASHVLYVTCVGDAQLDVSLAHEMESDAKAQEFLDTYIRLVEACADASTQITLQELIDQLK